MREPAFNTIAISIRDAAKAVGLSRSSLYSLLRAGAITARRHGRRTLVDVLSLRSWLDGLPGFRSGDSR